jgi:penicillin-insensitive murein endopeptidase
LKAIIIGCLLLITALDSSAGVVAQRWAKITQPTQGAAQSIGTFTAGCLGGAATLPLDGTGYQVMRLSRRRYFGHPNLIQFIEQLGQTAAAQNLGTVLVGDLGQPRGGPTLSGHRSHQTGLDVDMWFLMIPPENSRTLTAEEREKWSAHSVLVPHSYEIDLRHWSIANELVLEAAARMPEVDRIFVNPSVKRHLCNQAGVKRDWLRKVRPWWKHDDHFHVRLKCPNDSRECESQDPLPQGDGCDAKLAWWFTQEAKHPAPSPIKEPVEPILPASCEAILQK